MRSPLISRWWPLGRVAPKLLVALAAFMGLGMPAWANSPLLETVKQNPALAKDLCSRFRGLNAQGQSATGAESIAVVATSQGLNAKDAEVLTIYVIGLHCPDVH